MRSQVIMARERARERQMYWCDYQVLYYIIFLHMYQTQLGYGYNAFLCSMLARTFAFLQYCPSKYRSREYVRVSGFHRFVGDYFDVDIFNL